MLLLHNTGLIILQRPQKNWKRPMKVRKAKSKARHEEISFFHIFSAWMCSLEGFRLVFLLVWNFKVKKAATETQTWKSKKLQLFCRKFGQSTLFIVNINAWDHFQSSIFQNGDFKGQNDHEGCKNWKIWKKIIK